MAIYKYKILSCLTIAIIGGLALIYIQLFYRNPSIIETRSIKVHDVILCGILSHNKGDFSYLVTNKNGNLSNVIIKTTGKNNKPVETGQSYNNIHSFGAFHDTIYLVTRQNDIVYYNADTQQKSVSQYKDATSVDVSDNSEVYILRNNSIYKESKGTEIKVFDCPMNTTGNGRVYKCPSVIMLYEADNARIVVLNDLGKYLYQIERVVDVHRASQTDFIVSFTDAHCLMYEIGKLRGLSDIQRNSMQKDVVLDIRSYGAKVKPGLISEGNRHDLRDVALTCWSDKNVGVYKAHYEDNKIITGYEALVKVNTDYNQCYFIEYFADVLGRPFPKSEVFHAEYMGDDNIVVIYKSGIIALRNGEAIDIIGYIGEVLYQADNVLVKRSGRNIYICDGKFLCEIDASELSFIRLVRSRSFCVMSISEKDDTVCVMKQRDIFVSIYEYDTNDLLDGVERPRTKARSHSMTWALNWYPNITASKSSYMLVYTPSDAVLQLRGGSRYTILGFAYKYLRSKGYDDNYIIQTEDSVFMFRCDDQGAGKAAIMECSEDVVRIVVTYDSAWIVCEKRLIRVFMDSNKMFSQEYNIPNAACVADDIHNNCIYVYLKNNTIRRIEYGPTNEWNEVKFEEVKRSRNIF